VKSFATIIWCTLLTACAHLDSGSGVEFRYDRLKELQNGMTTTQVEALLGKPISIEKTQQETIYGYTFGNVKAFKMALVSSNRTYENATARLVFKDQLLQSFSYEITEPKK
jgi:outer membrane protein assembly factor BamE (lipoprotein component of BamABCDE complex)